MLFVLMASVIVGVVGCGKKADENKPIEEVKSEAATMSVDDLKDMAAAYKDKITAKKADLEKLTAKLKEIPITEMLGEDAKQIKADMENITKSVKNLTDRFQIYYNKFKEQGGDTSGLQI